LAISPRRRMVTSKHLPSHPQSWPGRPPAMIFTCVPDPRGHRQRLAASSRLSSGPMFDVAYRCSPSQFRMEPSCTQEQCCGMFGAFCDLGNVALQPRIAACGAGSFGTAIRRSNWCPGSRRTTRQMPFHGANSRFSIASILHSKRSGAFPHRLLSAVGADSMESGRDPVNRRSRARNILCDRSSVHRGRRSTNTRLLHSRACSAHQ
jgi:hypothetical protein